MNRMIYRFHQTFLKIIYQKKRYLLYMLSFYIGLLLPAFCLANIRSVDRVIHYVTFDNMKEAVQIDWLGREFDLFEPDEKQQHSVKAFYEEDFTEWDNQYVSIVGIDNSYFYPVPEVKGRAFSEKELKEGAYVCLLDEQNAEKHACQIGDMISIRGVDFELIGLTKDKLYSGFLVPYYAMKGIYQTEEQVQFTGTFLADKTEDKEKISYDVPNKIMNGDAHAEVISITDGEELYRMAVDSKNQWRFVRGTIAAVAGLFFILNEIIVLMGKIEKERHMIGVHRALGASAKEVKAGLFCETLIITLFASVMVLITLQPLARLAALENIVVMDGVTAAEIFLIAIVTCELVTWGVMRDIKSKQIATMLRTREL